MLVNLKFLVEKKMYILYRLLRNNDECQLGQVREAHGGMLSQTIAESHVEGERETLVQLLDNIGCSGDHLIDIHRIFLESIVGRGCLCSRCRGRRGGQLLLQ